MARIAGVDLPPAKRVVISLQYIYGIGNKTAQDIVTKAGVDLATRTTRFLRITLHLSQIFFTDARTFMATPTPGRAAKSCRPLLKSSFFLG